MSLSIFLCQMPALPLAEAVKALNSAKDEPEGPTRERLAEVLSEVFIEELSIYSNSRTGARSSKGLLEHFSDCESCLEGKETTAIS